MTKLLKFSVKGYRNFSAPITIDFTDVHDYKFSKECISDGVITKIGIYGANGCGKSNLGLALFNIVSHLTYKESYLLKSNPNIFLNVDDDVEEVVFSYTFLIDGDYYTLEYYKESEESITREIFSQNDHALYDYDYKTRSFIEKDFRDLIPCTLNFAYVENKISIIRYIANNSALAYDSPIKAIMDFVSHMLWVSNHGSNDYIGLENRRVNAEEWIVESGSLQDFNDFLSDVCNINIELDSVYGFDGRPLIVEKHKGRMLPFRVVASSGLNAALYFYYWMRRFSKVSLLFIDDIDSYLPSTKIVEKLKEYPEMQAVFTAHSTALLSDFLLRPDCYLIFENAKLRSFHDMAGDREIREGHNLEKIYRSWENPTKSLKHSLMP